MEELMEHHDTSLDYATLEWGIKESFRSYFEHLQDHNYIFTDGACKRDDGQIEFQANPVHQTESTFSFKGTVQLTAHFGALSVKIANPTVDIQEGGTATLSAEIDEVDGKPVRLVIANLAHNESSTSKQPHLSFRAELAEKGQYLFMGNYFAGDELDPVTIWFTTP